MKGTGRGLGTVAVWVLPNLLAYGGAAPWWWVGAALLALGATATIWDPKGGAR